MRRAAVLVVVIAACQADLPQLTDAHGVLDGKCTGPYADSLIDYFPSTLMNPSNALGAPDNMTVTISANDQITVGFVGLGGVTDANGTDIHVAATYDSGAMATVNVAAADMQYAFTGNISSASSDLDIMLSQKPFVLYVRIIGVTGNIQLDAVVATHDMCR
jgi:hypothetical protein